MRADAEAVVKKKKKRSSERSKRLEAAPQDAEGEWQQFTSPDGHPYYYNALTRESRWELPTVKKSRSKHRRAKGSSKDVAAEAEAESKEAQSDGKETAKSAVKQPKNAMFQQLQASLEGKLNVMPSAMMGRPPMVSIRREEDSYSGGAVAEETKTQTLEETYEAETADMSAAERLRFLRRKRQEEMLAKKASVAEDDFMAEFASNMKKKGVTRTPKREEAAGDKAQQRKEQEAAEEERKKQQMMEEKEAKEQEAQRKEREQQAAMEREKQREQERAEQLALEQQREEERRQRQEDQERARQAKEEAKMKKKEQVLKEIVQNGRNHESHDDRKSSSSVNEMQDDGNSPAVGESSAEGRKHRSRSRGSKHGSLVLSAQEEMIDQPENVVKLSPSHTSSQHSGITVTDEITEQDEKRRAREERKARKQQEHELAASPQREQAQTSAESDLLRKPISSAGDQREEPITRSTSSAEAEEEARAREKQLRRERRRMAKMEAAMAAQQINESGSQESKRSQGEGMSEQMLGHAGSGSINGSADSGNTGNSQAQPVPPPFSGGMYAPYPYMMPPQPPPPPYGYYYPYLQQPPMMPMPMPMYPPSMGGMPSGYQMMPQPLPPSSGGVATPSAMIPYSADSTYQSAYGYGMPFGQQTAPELSRCECCQGIGVGLVEKNGVCAHCNRLRLAFIVDSAQMRQRCLVCGGWGFRLLQANGMCEHCTRQTSQKAQAKGVTEAAARRRISVAASVTAAIAPPRQSSTGNPAKTDGLDDIEWDKSSSDNDSDWDD